jgi:hypothetical protein
VDQVHGVMDRQRDSGPWWTEGGANKRRGGASPARAHVCLGLPALAVEDEEDEAELEAGSPEHERWWRGGATAAKDSHRVGARARGGGAVVAVAGGARGFIQGLGERWGGVTTGG